MRANRVIERHDTGDLVVLTERIGAGQYVTQAWHATRGPMPQFTMYADSEAEARAAHIECRADVRAYQRGRSQVHNAQLILDPEVYADLTG